MDRVALREKAGQLIRKYKYALLILILGLVLMGIPTPEEAEPELEQEPPAAVQEDTAAALESILAQIDGVGKVKVMLTPATGEETYYQTDVDQSSTADSGSTRSETVIITDADRAQAGLVRKVDPPTWLGAIVVCQGAERATVQLAVVEAVANVTGLGADRISVLKMK